jgi:DNA-directed RNA polymerase specialized sigma24 family protein
MSAKLLDKTEDIVNAYVLKNQSLREIADFYSVSSGSIRSVLKKAGVNLRKRGRRPSGVVTTAAAPVTTTDNTVSVEV